MTVTLTHDHNSQTPLSCTFDPAKGMSLVSFKIGNLELIEPTNENGLIGPHFGKRYPSVVPEKSPDGDPYIDGVAHYAPWDYDVQENQINATLTSKSELNGRFLSQLEGQNFKMQFSAKLSSQGLEMVMSVMSDTDSVIGLRTSWKKLTKVQSKVQFDEHKKELFKDRNQLEVNLNGTQIKGTFNPYNPNICGTIQLQGEGYGLTTRYIAENQENSWTLTQQAGQSNASLAIVSSLDPKRPNLTASSLKIFLEPSMDHL